MRIDEYMKIERPEIYDFKEETANALFAKIKSPIEKFILYKLQGIRKAKYFPEMDTCIREKRRKFELQGGDCDTLPLTKEIYKLLWEDAIKNCNESTISGKYGDTMTSFQNLLNLFVEDKIENEQQAIYRKKYYPTKDAAVTKVYLSHLYFSMPEFVKNFEKYDDVNRFASAVHQVGNFIPVPRYFNTYRKHHDSWDLTMCKIREWYFANTDKERRDVLDTLLCKKNNVVRECEKWLDWCGKREKGCKGWENFIACNYLESFVDKNGIPIMFFAGHKWDSHRHLNGDDIIKICETCSNLIEKRGVAMVSRIKEMGKEK